jgi:STE24 endopeptidase
MKDFSEEEIETVFAHELGHYKRKHILVGIAIGTLSTFVGLFIAARLYEWSLEWFGFRSPTEIAALPLLALWLTLFGVVTAPLGNMLSRRHERQADAYAVQTTANRTAFVSALRKLAVMNLVDTEPHPLVEWMFYSHPSIAKRINMVEALGRA